MMTIMQSKDKLLQWKGGFDNFAGSSLWQKKQKQGCRFQASLSSYSLVIGETNWVQTSGSEMQAIIVLPSVYLDTAPRLPVSLHTWWLDFVFIYFYHVLYY